MVSRNLSGIADQFDDMVEDRDWRGFVALAGIGAVGGVLAEMFQDRIAPRLNQPQSPTSARGLAGSFAMKAGAAVLLGAIAARSSGDIALGFAVLGVGAAVDAGVDLIDAADSMRSASPRLSGGSSSQNRRQVQPAQTRSTGSPASGSSSASANLDQRGAAGTAESLLAQV